MCQEAAGLCNAPQYDLPLTQEQLGQATGITSVHVNRTIQGLHAEGLIKTNSRSMTILDWDGLQAAGDFNRVYLHDAVRPRPTVETELIHVIVAHAGCAHNASQMRYFFNTLDGGYDRDETGQEFGSLAAARLEAVRFAGEILRDQPGLAWAGEDFRLDVTDNDEVPVFSVIISTEDYGEQGHSVG